MKSSYKTLIVAILIINALFFFVAQLGLAETAIIVFALLLWFVPRVLRIRKQ